MKDEDKFTRNAKLAFSIGALYMLLILCAFLQAFSNNEWLILLGIIAYLISLIYIFSSN